MIENYNYKILTLIIKYMSIKFQIDYK